MNGISIDMNSLLSPAMRQDGPATTRAESFPGLLSSASVKGDREILQQSVEQLVSSSLVLPTLATLRESTMSTGPFAPGAAERRFGPLLDQHIADQVTQGANFPLVRAIVNKLARAYDISPPASMNASEEIRHA